MFPDDTILIARGKYSTLSNERHEQLKRVQEICNTIITASQGALKDCHEKPPVNKENLIVLGNCLSNFEKARERLITLALGMNELQQEAWPK